MCMKLAGITNENSALVLMMGFQDGALRMLRLTADKTAWQLIYAAKAHAGAVNAVAMSDGQDRMASVSEDGTAFLFGCTDLGKVMPLGFVQLPSVATAAAWAARPVHLVVACRNGMLVEIPWTKELQKPVGPGQSFLKQLPLRILDLNTAVPTGPSSRPPSQHSRPTTATTAAPVVASQPTTAPTAAPAVASDAPTGLSARPVSQHGKDPTAATAGADPAAAVAESGSVSGDQGGRATFLVGSSSNAGGLLHEVALRPAWAYTACVAWQGAGVSTMEMNTAKTQLTTGSMDGLLEVARINGLSLTEIASHEQMRPHDASMAITCLARTSDSAWIVTAAEDGTVLLLSRYHPAQWAASQPQPSQPARAVLPENISEPSTLTMEQAQQKAREDASQSAVDACKADLRERCGFLQRHMEGLLKANDAKPRRERLPLQAFSVDPHLHALVQQQFQKQGEAAEQAARYETARLTAAMRKLKENCPPIADPATVTVYAFQTGVCLRSYPVRPRPPDMSQAIRTLAAQVEAEDAASASVESKKGTVYRKRFKAAVMAATAFNKLSQGPADSTNASAASRPIPSTVSKQEQRRLARKKRQQEWQDFNADRPQDAYESPEDLQLIEKARQTFADYSLKSGLKISALDGAANLSKIPSIRSFQSEAEWRTAQAELQMLMASFDDQMGQLRDQQLATTAELQKGQLRQALLSQEAKLLQDLAPEEDRLKQESAAKKADVRLMVARMDEADVTVEQRRLEVQAAKQSKQQMEAAFELAVEGAHPAREPLLQIFQRRARSPVLPGKAKEEDNEDGTASESEAGSDNEEEEATTCPHGCSNSLFEEVLKMQQDNQEAEAELQAALKGHDAAKREHDVLSKRHQTALLNLKVLFPSALPLQASDEELMALQSNKQKQLNDIDVLVTLNLEQVQAFARPGGATPHDLASVLVFSLMPNELQELETDRSGLLAKQRELQMQHDQMVSDRRTKQAQVAELQQRIVEVQQFKFGQIVNLEVLDTIGYHKGSAELHAKQAEQAVMHTKELAGLQSQSRLQRAEAAKLMQLNTQLLTLTASEKLRIRPSQNSPKKGGLIKAKSSVEDAQRAWDTLVSEQHLLMEKVDAQASEIEQLQAHVTTFQKKNTNINAAV
ncbi:hypothetical protein WJX74_006216 [Apatococcus lobatus]|uniref:Cilia- and flagella-associated protein 43 n=1 Tax=Apatococcus lobatus TaxID=904363 RepID=A0AAW1Q951_9CHLO